MHPVRLSVLLAVSLTAGLALAQSATSTGVSRDLNPALSVNTLLLGRVADKDTDAAVNGMDLQEAEMQFTSIVDPFWKANLILAVHPADEGYEVEVEVATIDASLLPHGFGLKLGKDYLPFGKHAPLHTHQYPFIDPPVGLQGFLGGEGLSEVGARLSHAVPLPWYADLDVYAVDGGAEIFDAASRDLVFGARFANLLDLGDTATLELGGSWLHGPHAPGFLDTDPAVAGTLDLLGADITYKWVSASSSQGPACEVTAEVILPQVDGAAGDPFGWYANARYRFARSWWVGAQVGGLDRDLADPAAAGPAALFGWDKVRETKANLTWAPSEFSALRLEVAHYDDQIGQADDTLVSLQANFTIGSHPAHMY
ncbi:MAG: hypothetical protein R3D98_12000 [Candidatus Krumholzibacteriia bacterium]